MKLQYSLNNICISGINCEADSPVSLTASYTSNSLIARSLTTLGPMLRCLLKAYISLKIKQKPIKLNINIKIQRAEAKRKKCTHANTVKRFLAAPVPCKHTLTPTQQKNHSSA